MIKLLLTLLVILTLLSIPTLADYKITQRTTMEGVSFELTTWAKGVRERREQKMSMAGMEGMDMSMMEGMMPNLTTISQCDLKQDVSLNDKKKLFFIDYYDWSTVPAEKLQRRPTQKVVIKGTMTVSSTVTDSGKRQQMFGLTARWLKAVRTMESSADSCDGASNMRIEEEGWFVDLTLNRDTCQVPLPQGSPSGGCRPKMIVRSMQYPGFFLEGTTTMYQDGKKTMTTKLETTALSKAPLDQALFEIPKDYTEADSLTELTKAGMGRDTTAITQVVGENKLLPSARGGKTVAIDFFSGSTSKVDESQLRMYLADKLAAAGITGYAVGSQAEIESGNFVNVIGVEIKKVKESTGAKIGGLFGKVTGVDDAAKAGDSEAELVITVYAKDRKTVVVTSSGSEKTKGKPTDAAKLAIDKAMPAIIAKLK